MGVGQLQRLLGPHWHFGLPWAPPHVHNNAAAIHSHLWTSTMHRNCKWNKSHSRLGEEWPMFLLGFQCHWTARIAEKHRLPGERSSYPKSIVFSNAIQSCSGEGITCKVGTGLVSSCQIMGHRSPHDRKCMRCQ